MSECATSPWIEEQTKALLAQRGHAWLLTGPSGLGQYSLALALARAWLCERPGALGACGACASCHSVDVRTHADLCVLMPEAVMQTLGWPLSEAAQSDLDDKKRKPSKEIRVEAMRDAVEFAQRTSARGRGKVILVYPAERMNVVSANTLLKTLEEPAGELKFVLASEAVHQLLPTIRSRCQSHTMLWPSTDVALTWLRSQGVDETQASMVLRAAGGRPQDALQFFLSEQEVQAWHRLPKAIAEGNVGIFKEWSASQAVSALQKLCHDMMALNAGAQPRFFEAMALPVKRPSMAALTAWAGTLRDSQRTVEHPFNPGLMLEALVSQAQNTLNSAP
jgi:DNA polymerase-3 subunit delta'